MGQTQQLLQRPSAGGTPGGLSPLGVHVDDLVVVALAAPVSVAPIKVDSTIMVLVLLRPVNAVEESPVTTPRKTIAAMKRGIIMLRLLKRLQEV